MATNVIIKDVDYKNPLHSFISSFLDAQPQESYPNGNGGMNDGTARALFTGESSPLKYAVIKRVSGDAYTVGSVVIDAGNLYRLYGEYLQNTKPVMYRGIDLRYQFLGEGLLKDLTWVDYISYENSQAIKKSLREFADYLVAK